MWLHGGKPGASMKPFDCDRDCGVDGEHVGRREHYGCSRTDLPEVDWCIDGDTPAFYMGRAADRRLHLRVGTSDPERPLEDELDGCPGGYQRARMLAPLHRYYRKRTDEGARVPNPFFDRCDDDLIISAILYLELEEERAHAEWMRCENAALKAEVERGS